MAKSITCLVCLKCNLYCLVLGDPWELQMKPWKQIKKVKDDTFKHTHKEKGHYNKKEPGGVIVFRRAPPLQYTPTCPSGTWCRMLDGTESEICIFKTQSSYQKVQSIIVQAYCIASARERMYSLYISRLTFLQSFELWMLLQPIQSKVDEAVKLKWFLSGQCNSLD